MRRSARRVLRALCPGCSGDLLTMSIWAVLQTTVLYHSTVSIVYCSMLSYIIVKICIVQQSVVQYSIG